ncbi:hypothetical protein [Tautonia marina]|uniref:hypothetical protein n=1 Tax=Tautonia marina TaxID=2653855 RepID=UPI0012612096|nr:hypothetical protein [Tautonia marina]
MNRIALSIALALGLAAGLPASADRPSPGAEVRPVSLPSWFADLSEGAVTPRGDFEPDGGLIVAKGRRSYSEERALSDARTLLEQTVAEWLAPDIPEGWPLPEEQVDALILDQHVEPIVLDLDRLGLSLAGDPEAALPQVLHVAAVRAELSPDHREAFLDVYRREVGVRRLTLLGGLVGFVLTCLAILALYIRADEATRGYYTPRLRVVALASAGAAGAVIARWVLG